VHRVHGPCRNQFSCSPWIKPPKDIAKLNKAERTLRPAQCPPQAWDFDNLQGRGRTERQISRLVGQSRDTIMKGYKGWPPIATVPPSSLLLIALSSSLTSHRSLLCSLESTMYTDAAMALLRYCTLAPPQCNTRAGGWDEARAGDHLTRAVQLVPLSRRWPTGSLCEFHVMIRGGCILDCTITCDLQ
jgi:hypothetical protein